jgi:two-component system cell cycle sensor histidine kinase/response regulator CckA
MIAADRDPADAHRERPAEDTDVDDGPLSGAPAERVRRLQSLGEATASIAHDFKNLLTAILQGCELLAARGDLPQDACDEIAQVRGAAVRAQRLARQLLTVARGTPVPPLPIDVDATLLGLATMVDRLIGPAVTLALVPGCAGVRIRIDPDGFERAVVNLAVNGRDAMPDGGRLTIRTSTVAYEEPVERDGETIAVGHYVLVEVVDTGVGIPELVRRRLFEPFVTTKEDQGGTGLGLAVVRRVVDAAGGHVVVHSAERQGSSFGLLLPVDGSGATTAAESDAGAGIGSTGRGKVILLVEDEEPIRAFAARALRIHGYRVIEAASAEEALEAIDLATTVIDLVVTDLMLPATDGRTFARQLRRQRPGLPVVLVSGYEDRLDAPTVGEPEFAVLAKPYSLKELVDAVDERLGSDQPAA